LNIPGIGLSRFLLWFGLWGWTRLLAATGRFPSEATIPSVGFLHTGGRMDCAMVLGILDKLAEKGSCSRVEFILHPGLSDNHTQNKYRHWGYFWENDLTLLLHNDLRKGLEMRHIKTTSFGEER
jgi:hypothetical protein